MEKRELKMLLLKHNWDYEFDKDLKNRVEGRKERNNITHAMVECQSPYSLSQLRKWALYLVIGLFKFDPKLNGYVYNTFSEKLNHVFQKEDLLSIEEYLEIDTWFNDE